MKKANNLMNNIIMLDANEKYRLNSLHKAFKRKRSNLHIRNSRLNSNVTL